MGGRRMRVSAVATVVGVAVGLVAAPPVAMAGDRSVRSQFTLVVLPDTQLAVQNKPELFSAQTEWIVANRQARNIRFVVHVGDVVEWPSRVSDWERGTAAMARLNGVVPYTVGVGNHDFDAWACNPPTSCDPNQAIATDRSTTMFNRYFPRRLFAGWPSFGGSHPRGSSDNTFFTFTAGGVDWLVLSLKYRPTDGELVWANRVIASNRDRQVILNTHEYQDGTARSAVGERIWNTVARRHRNVRFVLSGHYVAAGARVDVGDNGNTVHQIQADYQTYSIPMVDENSYLRLMAFDTRAGTVGVTTFSPYCAATGQCPSGKTDPANQFELTGVDLPHWRYRPA
jgi:hypothetical protein